MEGQGPEKNTFLLLLLIFQPHSHTGQTVSQCNSKSIHLFQPIMIRDILKVNLHLILAKSQFRGCWSLKKMVKIWPDFCYLENFACHPIQSCSCCACCFLCKHSFCCEWLNSAVCYLKVVSILTIDFIE